MWKETKSVLLLKACRNKCSVELHMVDTVHDSLQTHTRYRFILSDKQSSRDRGTDHYDNAWLKYLSLFQATRIRFLLINVQCTSNRQVPIVVLISIPEHKKPYIENELKPRCDQYLNARS